MSYYSQIMRCRPNLLVYYRLGEASGTVAKDSSGNGYDGTINGGVTLGQPGAIRGEPNTAMLFDGSTGHATLPAGVHPETYSQFTVEMWFWQAAAQTSYARIFSDDETGSSLKGIDINISPASDAFSPCYANFGFGGSSSHTLSVGRGLGIAGNVFANGVWYHIVITYDATTYRSYVNGVLSPDTYVGGPAAQGSFAFAIGYNPAYSGDYLAGRVDEVGVYSAALSGGQIAANYHAGIDGNIVRSSHRLMARLF